MLSEYELRLSLRTVLGYLLAIVILGAIFFAPAVIILRSTGPTLATRFLWALLSVSVIAVLLVVGLTIRFFGSEQLHEGFRQFWYAYDPYIIVSLYVVPLAVYIAFRSLIASKYQCSDEQKTRSETEYTRLDISAVKSKYVRMQVAFYSFVLFVGAGFLASSLTQQDWPLYFSPFMLLTYLLSAIAIGRLANALGRRGQFWGWLAIICPVLGAAIGYGVNSRAANQLINQIRWKVSNT